MTQLQQGLFAVKLRELEREYGRLQSRIYILQNKDVQQVGQELERLRDECREQALLLKECVSASHTPIMAALAQAQVDYHRRTQQIWEDAWDGAAEHAEYGVTDRAEAAALFAEYAIDFATQSMRQALAAALTAVVMQQSQPLDTQQEQGVILV